MESAETIKTVTTLEPNFAGQYAITRRILKWMLPFYKDALTHIINTSLQNSWKKSLFILLPEKSNIENSVRLKTNYYTSTLKIRYLKKLPYSNCAIARCVTRFCRMCSWPSEVAIALISVVNRCWVDVLAVITSKHIIMVPNDDFLYVVAGQILSPFAKTLS